MRALNVCLVNDSFPPLIDGVSNAVKNYAEIISSNGGKASVVTPYYPNTDDSVWPFPVIRYPSVDMTRLVGYRAGMPFSASVMRRLQSSHFNIIHSHCPITSTMLARTLRDRIKAPLVLTYHTKFDIDIANAVKNKQLQDIALKLLVSNISACDEVWTVSNGAGDNLRKLGYEGRYVVVPNGVDLPKGRVNDEQICQATKGFDLPKGVPVFLFVGRMMWYKGIRLMLDALRRLKADGADFRMVFIGKGTDKDAIKAYARSLCLDDKVFFSPAIHDREVLRAWYCRADLFLFPSTFDTNGLVVREAAACALPSVLIKGSCAAEDVSDGVNGFLIEENADSMAAMLTKLCHCLQTVRQVGESAQYDLYVSWEDSVKQASARYETVIDNYQAGHYPKREQFSDDMLHAAAAMMDYFNRRKDHFDSLKTGAIQMGAEWKAGVQKIGNQAKDKLDNVIRRP